MEKAQKTERTKFKTKLTRLGSKINLFIGDDDKEGLKSHLDLMKSVMRDLEELHVKVLEMMSLTLRLLNCIFLRSLTKQSYP